MNESKKIIAALILTVLTILSGCIIVDCNMSDITNERPYTLIVANRINHLAKDCVKTILDSVRDL